MDLERPSVAPYFRKSTAPDGAKYAVETLKLKYYLYERIVLHIEFAPVAIPDIDYGMYKLFNLNGWCTQRV